MTLRVNRLWGTREQYGDALTDAGMAFVVDDECTDAIHLVQAVPVEHLPLFNQAAVSVQDSAAQMATDWLVEHAEKQGRVLDACAAPGGKTAHIVERKHFREVIALEIDNTRLIKLNQTLARLDLEEQVNVVLGDASEPDDWWDGNPFDAILIDAPCSGTGVVRRHPDIKLLRREADINNLVEIQKSVLDALWNLLRPGGVLLYCTCSVLKDENEHQITRFLTSKKNARLLRPVSQTLTGQQNRDGFFYAMIEKDG